MPIHTSIQKYKTNIAFSIYGAVKRKGRRVSDVEIRMLWIDPSYINMNRLHD
jgi:hypothetical protein